MKTKLVLEATGESVTINRSAADTLGEYVEFVNYLPAGKKVTTMHVHPQQTEYFEVIEGELGLALEDRRLIFQQGESYELPRNTEHTFYNPAGKDIRWKVVMRPALNSEWITREMLEASNRNKSTRPSGFESANILASVGKEYYETTSPRWFQRMFYPLISLIGRMLGLTNQVAPKTTIISDPVNTSIYVKQKTGKTFQACY